MWHIVCHFVSIRKIDGCVGMRDEDVIEFRADGPDCRQNQRILFRRVLNFTLVVAC